MLTRIAQGALIVLFVVWTVVGSSHGSMFIEICEKTSGGEQNCASYDIFFYAIWQLAKFFDHYSALIAAIATGFIAYFTFTLKRSTDKLWDAGEKQISVAKQSAEAASLNAKAVLRAEQSHVFPIIKQESIVELIRLWGRHDSSPGLDRDIIQGIGLSYHFKNYGRTPAIIKMVSHQLVHSADPPVHYPLIVPVPVDKILGPGDATDEPMVCSLESAFSVADAMSVLRGKTTIWFCGFVAYDDLFGFERRLDFIWHYNGSLDRLRWHSFQGSETTKKT
jgi:hypothetical protein